MVKILCFGDSNTYGFNPSSFLRYNKEERWSGVLSQKYDVVEAGCNNRACFNNSGEMNAIKILPKYLTQKFDYIIIQLGINDLQFQYNVDLAKFESKFCELLDLIQKDAKIILLCPQIIDEVILKSYFSNLFNQESIEKSKKLFDIYEKISKKYNCKLINLNQVAQVSNIDGLHYDIENHHKIAQKIIKILE